MPSQRPETAHRHPQGVSVYRHAASEELHAASEELAERDISRGGDHTEIRARSVRREAGPFRTFDRLDMPAAGSCLPGWPYEPGPPVRSSPRFHQECLALDRWG